MQAESDGPDREQSLDSAEMKLLAAYLAEHDVACPRCGYNLRGLTNAICPECGDGLRLHVVLTEPRMGAYIALLVACSVGFGGSLLFGALGFVAAPAEWWAQPSAIILLAQLVLCGVTLPSVLLRRTRLRRREPRTQYMLAAAAWIVVLTLSTLIVILFDE